MTYFISGIYFLEVSFISDKFVAVFPADVQKFFIEGFAHTDAQSIIRCKANHVLAELFDVLHREEQTVDAVVDQVRNAANFRGNPEIP